MAKVVKKTVTAPVMSKVRCAVYTRKSTEEGLEQEFNSLDAQREACEKYVQIHQSEGWTLVADNYDDGGFSGGNVERPALKRLMDDIENGKIDVIVVYKIDRLSRSLLDFLNLMQLFERHRVSFVSVTQHFDTSNSMGKLMLNVLLSFAQFEREITGERIRDKIASSKRKGMWMGGPPPLGYDVIDRKLVINAEEAAVVRLIFETFVMKRSMKLLRRTLCQQGITSKARVTSTGKHVGGNVYDANTLYKILNNPLYLGKIKHKEQLYDGQHAAIITQELWDSVRNVMQVSPQTRGNATKRKVPSVLLGLLRCGGCDSAMSPRHTKKNGGKIYRYYVPSLHMKGKCESCPISQVAAPEIEGLVLEELQGIFSSPDILLQVWRTATSHDPSITEAYVRNSLSNIVAIWRELFPAEQQRLLALILEKVVLRQDALDVQVRAEGLYALIREINALEASKGTPHDRA